MQKNEATECEIYREMLYDYVSDNLSEQDKAAFLLHINNCPECKRELSELEAIMSAASELEELEVPDSLRTAVSASLAAESVKIRKRRSFRRYTVGTVLPIAACAALAIGIYSGGIYDKFTSSDEIFNTTESASPSQETEENTISESNGQPSVQNDLTPTQSEDAHDTQTNNVPQGTSERTTERSTSPSHKTVGSATPETDVRNDNTTSTENTNTSAVSETPVSEQPENSYEAVDDEISAETGSIERKLPAPASAKDSAPASGGGGSASGAAASGGSASDTAASGGSASSNSLPAPEKASATVEEAEAPAAYTTPDSSPVEEYDKAYSDEDGKAHDDDKHSKKAYCTVVVDNPGEFAEGFGIHGKSGNTIHFEVSASRWREFVNYCRSYGAYVNADFADDFSSVSVTVTNN